MNEIITIENMEAYTAELKTKVISDVEFDGHKLTVTRLDGTAEVKDNKVFCIPDYWYVNKELLSKLGYADVDDYKLCASRCSTMSDDYDDDMVLSSKIVYVDQTNDYVIFADTAGFWKYRSVLTVGDDEHVIEMKIAYKKLDTQVAMYLNYDKNSELDFNIITCDYDGEDLSDTDTLKLDLENVTPIQKSVICEAGYDNTLNNKTVMEI